MVWALGPHSLIVLPLDPPSELWLSEYLEAEGTTDQQVGAAQNSGHESMNNNIYESLGPKDHVAQISNYCMRFTASLCFWISSCESMTGEGAT